jgi:hypothetical protein
MPRAAVTIIADLHARSGDVLCGVVYVRHELWTAISSALPSVLLVSLRVVAMPWGQFERKQYGMCQSHEFRPLT